MAENGQARRLRQRLNAVSEYVGLYMLAPITEGYAHLPAAVEEDLRDVLGRLDRLDRTLAKIDGIRGVVGGEVRLVEESGPSSPEGEDT